MATDEEIVARAALRIQCVFRCTKAKRLRSQLTQKRKVEFAARCDSDLESAAAITLQAAQRRLAARKAAEDRRGDTSVTAGSHTPPPSLLAAGSTSTRSRPASQVRVVRDGASAVSDGEGRLTVSGAVSVPEILKSGHFSSASSFMGASLYAREGLTTAFALSSVASFAALARDDPAAAEVVKQWDPSSLHPTLIHECAAIVIQCKWRVYSAKTRFLELKVARSRSQNEENEHELQEVSALAIQRNFRGHATRAHIPSQRPSSAPQRRSTPLTEDAAATKIQCMHRCHVARREVDKRRLDHRASFEAEVEESRKEEAARLIQANQRRHADQRRLRERAGSDAAANAENVAHRAGPTSSVNRASRLRNDVNHAAGIAAGSGVGLSALFYASCGALLESKGLSADDRCMFWGVRVLHAVAMDIAMEGATNDTAEPRLPSLEITRWIQGPLGSVVPLTLQAARGRSHSKDGGTTSPQRSGRLPALEGDRRRSPSPTPPVSSEPSPESRPKRLEPLHQ